MSGRTTVGELLAAARRVLATAPFDAPGREASLLLGRQLDLSEASLLAHPERPVAAAPAERFRRLVERRAAGEPVAYLLGEREFWGRRFRVDPRVLVPRPETEHLIEAALELDLPERPRIVDVGTGSGCLAITLALELPGARVVGTDLSPGALALAADNGRRLGGGALFAAGDLTSSLALDRVDLVVSNPPYVARSEAATLSPEIVDHEPHLALFAAERGLGVYRRLLADLRTLPSGARAALEIGAGQAAEVTAAAGEAGLVRERALADLAGIDRVLVLRRR